MLFKRKKEGKKTDKYMTVDFEEVISVRTLPAVFCIPSGKFKVYNLSVGVTIEAM